MKLSLLGVGNAGTRIVDRLVEAEAETGREFTEGNVLAFDTSTAAFAETTSIPEERRVLIGDTHPAVTEYHPEEDSDSDADVDSGGDGEPVGDGDGEDDANASGASTGDASPDVDEVRPGVGGDPDVGAAVARDDLPEIRRALDMVDETEVDATLVVAGLGGGTGSGVGSALLEELQSSYEEPVYVLGVLPAETESDERALTAARGVRTIVPLADAVIPVDNEAWRAGEARIADRYGAINDEIATRILALFAAGELDPGTPSEMRIDPTDVSRTLGVGGLAAIGHVTIETDSGRDGLLARLLALFGIREDDFDTTTDAATIKRLVRRALESKLTTPCDVSSSDRVLLILSGPPSEISRKGFETGRYLLEQETGTVEVLAGDEPLPGTETITATVLFANVTDVPRIEELQRRGLANREASAASEEAAASLAADRTDSSEPTPDDRGFEFGENGDGSDRDVAIEDDDDDTDAKGFDAETGTDDETVQAETETDSE